MTAANAAGKFVTLEGIEGAGKSSLVTAIVGALERAGHVVCATREPGGTTLAERVRQIVLEPGPETISATTETLLMFAARGIHLDNRIRPALAAGEWVVCDRFTDATRAYQGAGRGVSHGLIEALASSIHGDLQPDLTLLVDVPVELGLARARQRQQVADRIEAQTVAFFTRVRSCYLALAAADAKRYRVLDGTQSLEQVRAAAERAVLELAATQRGLPT
ncbi:MAG TPA: dTMP kinase [Steroidobacteraceae bacterium]|nr:dTMP kinase [Steroidobacteraceae bacterium]HRX90390.1 dTMP kinase [Steroidobacteraceae bacterium]